MKPYASRTQRASNDVQTAAAILDSQSLDRALNNICMQRFLKKPVEPRPLLDLQRLSFQERPAICICESYHAAQRYVCEALQMLQPQEPRPFIIHEMMPAHQQDYIIECLAISRDFAMGCPFTVFTSAAYYPDLLARLPWLEGSSETINAGGLSTETPRDTASSTTVSCICLRTGAGGRWVLTDHDHAATVSPLHAPSPSLTARLLRHTVEISGNRLAPYLAMMFDVPDAWKTSPELSVRSLLIFDNYTFHTGCNQPGVPEKIVWSDTLGIVYEGC